MPMISPEHLLGDLGVHAISSLWTKAGCRTEPVRVDYGEDLCVQTQLDGKVEPFRIWVQVKTMAKLNKTKRSKFYVRLSVGHLLKWAATVDPVFVCIFDEQTQRAYIVDPLERFGLWELISGSMAPKKTLTIHFSVDDLFTARRASLFLWKARINYHSALLALIESRRLPKLPNQAAKEWRKAENKLEAERIASTLVFLNGVKLFQGNNLDALFVRCVQNAAADFCTNPDTGPDAANCVHQAVSLCMLGFIAKKIGNVGLPMNLIYACMDTMWLYIQNQEQGLWKRLQRIRKLASQMSAEKKLLARATTPNARVSRGRLGS